MDGGPAATRQSVEAATTPPSPLSPPPPAPGLYVGGMPRRAMEAVTAYRGGARGCVADLVVNGDHHPPLAGRSAPGVRDCLP